MDDSYASMVLPTAIGPITVSVSSVGVHKIAFGATEDDRPGTAEASRMRRWARDELQEYFAGQRAVFEVPLDWRLSSGWALTVRQRLFDSVRYGRTIGYAELASLAGRPGGARAVGGVMAANPLPVVVPCHRVIAADGGLGGFAGSGGAEVETKRRLLQLEGAAPPTLF